MAGLLFVIGMLVLATLLVAGFRIERQSREQRIVDSLLIADAEVQSEHLRAQQAMNDAAGQSWRNLAG